MTLSCPVPRTQELIIKSYEAASCYLVSNLTVYPPSKGACSHSPLFFCSEDLEKTLYDDRKGFDELVSMFGSK